MGWTAPEPRAEARWYVSLNPATSLDRPEAYAKPQSVNRRYTGYARHARAAVQFASRPNASGGIKVASIQCEAGASGRRDRYRPDPPLISRRRPTPFAV